ELIQFGLLLIELALVFLDRAGKTSGRAHGHHDCQSDRQFCRGGNPQASHIYLVAKRYAAVNARAAYA
ncbi:MAG TPA: hypothetical protein VNF49_13265, partial [Candidatus Binataceae bacterium]|nr:hypothetical protein [Candidatus Binataceae bacterium]